MTRTRNITMESIACATLWGTTDREYSAEWRHARVAQVWTSPMPRSSHPFAWLEMDNGDILNTHTVFTDATARYPVDQLAGKRVSYRLRQPPATEPPCDVVFDRLIVGERVIIGLQHNAL